VVLVSAMLRQRFGPWLFPGAALVNRGRLIFVTLLPPPFKSRAPARSKALASLGILCERRVTCLGCFQNWRQGTTKYPVDILPN